jgi:phosphoribosylformylglycinamidine (FGAM) synthase-like enzyme
MGGLALAIARSAMAGELGVDLDLSSCPDLVALPGDVALFSESNGRFVITAAAKDAPRSRRCSETFPAAASAPSPGGPGCGSRRGRGPWSMPGSPS